MSPRGDLGVLPIRMAVKRMIVRAVKEDGESKSEGVKAGGSKCYNPYKKKIIYR